ncbi:MAG: M20/M25/M40 family metallo-hydrolase [Spirochaetia bacterium]
METAALLKELTEARGPSGYEEEVRQIVRARFAEYARDVRVDSLGNCIARLPGTGGAPADGTPAGSAPSKASRPALMLTAHMDEIALMVSQIEEGFLRELPGIVVSVPPHFTDPADREKPVPLDKLFIDVGLSPREVESLVHVGDLVTIRARWTELSGGYASCKSMDDRAAVAAIVLCLEELSRRSHAWDVYAVATVQEEVGSHGAMTGAFGIAPAAAVALDVTFGMQPGLSTAEAVKMDAGPTIALGPNFHPRLFDRLIDAAKAIELPHQVEPIPGPSGTDAWHIQVSRSGVPCGLVGIPVRYMHTPVETVCLRDVERAGRLLAELVCRLPLEFAESLETRDALAKGES